MILEVRCLPKESGWSLVSICRVVIHNHQSVIYGHFLFVLIIFWLQFPKILQIICCSSIYGPFSSSLTFMVKEKWLRYVTHQSEVSSSGFLWFSPKRWVLGRTYSALGDDLVGKHGFSHQIQCVNKILSFLRILSWPLHLQFIFTSVPSITLSCLWSPFVRLQETTCKAVHSKPYLAT